MSNTLPVIFIYLYNIPAYSFLIIREVLNFLISFLPWKTQQEVRRARDSLVGFAFIVFGRLLPTLHVPEVDLGGKVAIVTGANSGIGLQIATDLAERKATVYLACRTKAKADKAIESIIQKFPHANGKVHFAQLDTSSLVSVRAFAESWSKLPATKKEDDKKSTTPTSTRQIDILVHNAGIAAVPKGQTFSPDGFEITYATNFLGSFLLTYLLKEVLAPTARIILTSSTAQYASNISPSFAASTLRGATNAIEPGFHFPVTVRGRFTKVPSDFALYSNTKAMQGAFARALQHRFNASSRDNMRVVHYFTPDLTGTPILSGLNDTSIVSDFSSWMLSRIKRIAISVEQGAATGSWLAVEQRDDKVVDPKQGGAYWDQMIRLTSTPDLYNQNMLDRLWTRWENDAGIAWR